MASAQNSKPETNHPAPSTVHWSEGRNSILAAQNVDWEDVHQRSAAINAALAEEGEVAREVLEQVWARRADLLARVPVREEAGTQIELLLIQLGREVYGLDARHVCEVKPAAQITRVPRVPDWVPGVVNLRGRIFSVVDLRRFFEIPPAEHSRDDGAATAYLVVVETPEMEVALLVDDVLDVEIIPVGRVQDASGTVHSLRPEYVRGVVIREGGGANGNALMLVVLDLAALLADERLIVHEEIL